MSGRGGQDAGAATVPFRWIDRVGALAVLVAAVVLVARAPSPHRADEASLSPLPRPPLPAASAPGSQAGDRLDLRLPDPPVLPLSARAGDVPLSLRVGLPPGVLPWLLTVQGRPLRDDPEGARLDLDRRALRWGLNVVHVQGADRFGRPIDQAWPLLVGDTADGAAWIDGAVRVRLTREGFLDDDDRLDDLSAIARRQVAAALHRLPAVEAGPLTVSNWRASRVDVRVRPVAGAIAVEVALDRAYVDVEVDPIGRIEAFPIHRIWLDAQLRVGVDADGRPDLQLDSVEPHVDIMPAGHGVVAWLLDHGSWFLEIAAELLSQEPLREAITGVIDDALAHWVSRFDLETPPPLSPRRLGVEYRFGSLDVDEDGLSASIDVRAACDGDRVTRLGRLTHPGASWVPPLDLPQGAVVQVVLSADAVNGLFHALWRCGALDTQVAFADAHAELPLVVPSSVAATFDLPPVLQASPAGEMLVGIGGVRASVDYGDDLYDVAAVGLLPVELAPARGGGALEVRFAAQSTALELETDCLHVNGVACRDNPLFDRLAWLAVPFLPPIGAVVPLPDLRLSTDPDTAVAVRLDDIRFDPSGAFLVVAAGYEAVSGR